MPIAKFTVSDGKRIAATVRDSDLRKRNKLRKSKKRALARTVYHVRLVKVGGNAGGPTSTCDFTYDMFDCITGEKLNGSAAIAPDVYDATNNPEGVVYREENLRLAEARFGHAWRDGDDWKLECIEVPSFDPCAE